MNKKAALNLGISTVVVMVIAMVVIGAGVSFIRTFFTAGTEGLIGAFDGVGDLGVQPDRNNLFVIDRELVRGSPGDLIILKAGIYNPTTTSWDKIEFKSIACSTGLGTSNIAVQSVPQDILPGTFAGYQVGLKITQNDEGDPPIVQKKYVCMLTLHSTATLARPTNENDLPTKQITVEII